LTTNQTILAYNQTHLISVQTD